MRNHFLALLSVCIVSLFLFEPVLNAADGPDPLRFSKEIHKLIKKYPDPEPGSRVMVCTGSSSMRGWHSRLAEDLSPIPVIQRGFGGSTFHDLRFWADSLIVPIHPEAVLIYEGDNDIAAGMTPDSVVGEFTALAAHLRESLPALRFYILSVKPSPLRKSFWPAMKFLNASLERICAGDSLMTYIDVASAMLDDQEQMRPEIYRSDKLHLNDSGYDIWMKTVRSVLVREEALSRVDGWVPFGERPLLVRRITSPYAPFPDEKRREGHMYNDVLYTTEEHYQDSSVALCIPSGFNPRKPVTFVVYFHGWNGNIARSLTEFDLPGQIDATGRNIVFVLPEGPKNSPDSYGGKIENKDVFRHLIDSIADTLRADHLMGKDGWKDIVICGHSGAYGAIHNILARGGYPKRISDVYLFDALYAGNEDFLAWAKSGKGNFINIITEHGGTLENSKLMEEQFKKAGLKVKESQIEKPSDLKLRRKDRISFIYTKGLGHSDVVNPFLYLFLTR